MDLQGNNGLGGLAMEGQERNRRTQIKWVGLML